MQARRAGIDSLDEGTAWRIVHAATVAVLTWTTRDGATMCACVNPVFIDGHIYVTTSSDRAKVAALRRDPRCAMVFTSVEGSVTLQGHAAISEDPELTFMCLKALGEKHFPLDSAAQRVMMRHMNSPKRIALRITPGRLLSCDERRFAWY